MRNFKIKEQNLIFTHHFVAFNFYMVLNFNFYVVLFPSPVGKFRNNMIKNPDCVIKRTFSNISNITFVQVLINLLMYYHALLLNMLQHDFYPF